MKAIELPEEKLLEKIIEDATEPIRPGAKRKPYTILQKGLFGGKDMVLLLSCDTVTEAREVVSDLNYAFKPKRYYFHKTEESAAILRLHNKLRKQGADHVTD